MFGLVRGSKDLRITELYFLKITITLDPLPVSHYCFHSMMCVWLCADCLYHSYMAVLTNISSISHCWNRECSRVFGEEGLTLKLFVKRTAPFSILWTLTNYLHLLALHKLTATDASALYCCHKAFVFLLSWIILKDRFMGIRVSNCLSICC